MSRGETDFATDLTAGTDTSGTLTIGQFAYGQIGAADDSDWYAIRLDAGTVYDLRLTGSSLPGATFGGIGALANAQVELRDSAGNPIAAGNAGAVSDLHFTAPYSGTYYVRAATSDGGTGGYALSIGLDTTIAYADDYQSGSLGAPVTTGVTVNGVIERSSDGDGFTLSMNANTRYALAVDAPTFAAMTQLDTANFNNVAFSGNQITPGASGSYYLTVAAANAGATGSYALLFSPTMSADKPLATGSTRGDALTAAAGGGEVWGWDGNDTLSGSDSNDILLGGRGNDSFAAGGGDDWLDGEDGDDTVFGGSGNDSVRGLNDNDLIYGEAGDDDVNGNIGQDTVYGGDGADLVRGGQGNDVVYGDAGNDAHVNGNIGNDTVYGGAGSDAVFGGQNEDVLWGGDGNDVLSGDLGNDTLKGGAGADLFVFNANTGSDRIDDFNFAEGDRIHVGIGSNVSVYNSPSGEAVLQLVDGGIVTLTGHRAEEVQQSWLV